MEVILARPRGFCAGVVRAIQTVQGALRRYGRPVYVLHEIVHNRHVVEGLRQQGARFVDLLEEIPVGAVTVFSAHGVGKAVVHRARQRRLAVIDATCPLVAKVHRETRRYSAEGCEVVIIGHVGHPEVEGTRGQIEGPAHVLLTVDDVAALEIRDPRRVAYVTQTTLSVEETREVVGALKRRFPHIRGPDLGDICYATQTRQNAVRRLAREVDLLLVVGARNSSNTNRLRELGEQQGLTSYLVEDAGDVDPLWFNGASSVGVTAGASTPELLVTQVVAALGALGFSRVREMEGPRESASFRPPEPLQAQR
ncbi:MAG: 4-hydroxy-3-methylbut-2-enyl diphosphate reductase [Deferrisomatales bacterium]